MVYECRFYDIIILNYFLNERIIVFKIKSELPNYPNINYGRVVRLLAQLGYDKKDHDLSALDSIYAEDTIIKRVSTAGNPKTEKSSNKGDPNKFLERYKNVFDKNETKQKYLDMEKNGEFKIVDQIDGRIKSIGNGQFIISKNKDCSKAITQPIPNTEKKKLRIAPGKSSNDNGNSF